MAERYIFKDRFKEYVICDGKTTIGLHEVPAKYISNETYQRFREETRGLPREQILRHLEALMITKQDPPKDSKGNFVLGGRVIVYGVYEEDGKSKLIQGASHTIRSFRNGATSLDDEIGDALSIKDEDGFDEKGKSYQTPLEKTAAQTPVAKPVQKPAATLKPTSKPAIASGIKHNNGRLATAPIPTKK